jgi:uncharacterized protein DUF3363
MIGRLVARGLDDELQGTGYAVIDGVDRRAHHVRLVDLDATTSGQGMKQVGLRVERCQLVCTTRSSSLVTVRVGHTSVHARTSRRRLATRSEEQ